MTTRFIIIIVIVIIFIAVLFIILFIIPLRHLASTAPVLFDRLETMWIANVYS